LALFLNFKFCNELIVKRVVPAILAVHQNFGFRRSSMQKFNMPTLKFMVFLAILTGLANACKGIKYNNDDDNDEPIPDLNLTEENKQESYFVFGDSLSTGAVTHPDTVI